MAWHLAPSLARLRAEVNARWPSRDRASDGSIGDTAHQAGSSDHNPNGRGSVNAIDIDKDGVDVAAIIASFQRHPSAHYWIYNRQIADVDTGWHRRPYDGPNPHDKHWHGSIRQTVAAEQSTAPWGLEEDDVTPDQALKLDNADRRMFALLDGAEVVTGLVEPGTGRKVTEDVKPNIALRKLADVVTTLQTDVAKLVTRSTPPPSAPVVTDEQLERVLRKVIGSVG